MTILREFQHYMKMRRLRKKINYAFRKMREHEKDADSQEWRTWAQLNLVYLRLLDLEVSEYECFLKNKMES